MWREGSVGDKLSQAHTARANLYAQQQSDGSVDRGQTLIHILHNHTLAVSVYILINTTTIVTMTTTTERVQISLMHNTYSWVYPLTVATVVAQVAPAVVVILSLEQNRATSDHLGESADHWLGRRPDIQTEKWSTEGPETVRESKQTKKGLGRGGQGINDYEWTS